MTPFPENSDRVATISLTKQEETLVRSGFVVWEDIFEATLAQMVLEKLRRNLELTDILLRPVGGKTALSLEDLGL